MAILQIYEPPSPILRQVAKKIDQVDDDVRRLMDDMLETMYGAPGIGLAAPQVGISKRIIVMDIASQEEGKKPLMMANPEIIWKSDEISICQEGCLSVPGSYADVERPARVKIRYLDYNNQTQELEADGLLATCIQHEMDHLEGILFIDHLSTLKRDMVLRKLRKLQKDRA